LVAGVWIFKIKFIIQITGSFWQNDFERHFSLLKCKINAAKTNAPLDSLLGISEAEKLKHCKNIDKMVKMILKHLNAYPRRGSLSTENFNKYIKKYFSHVLLTYQII